VDFSLDYNNATDFEFGYRNVEFTYNGGKPFRGDIVVPEGTKKIGHEVFFQHSNINSVVLPSSVKEIDEKAFAYCTNLKSITLSDSLESIAPFAFFMCEELDSIIIPNSVTTLGACAFASCTKLRKLVLSNKITEIPNRAFSDCNNIESLTIPRTITTIGYSAFKSCKRLKSVTIPNSVKSIDYSAFGDCDSLTYIFSLIKEPASVYTDFYDKEMFSIPLYVLPGMKEVYQKTGEWKKFSTIVEMTEEELQQKEKEVDEATGIASIKAQQHVPSDRIYTLAGTYVGNDIKSLKKGIYIIHGKKVVIR
jgi:hypothetical protein